MHVVVNSMLLLLILLVLTPLEGGHAQLENTASPVALSAAPMPIRSGKGRSRSSTPVLEKAVLVLLTRCNMYNKAPLQRVVMQNCRTSSCSDLSSRSSMIQLVLVLVFVLWKGHMLLDPGGANTSTRSVHLCENGCEHLGSTTERQAHIWKHLEARRIDTSESGCVGMKTIWSHQ